MIAGKIHAEYRPHKDFVIMTTPGHSTISYAALFSYHFDQRQLRGFMHCLRGGSNTKAAKALKHFVAQTKDLRTDEPKSFLSIPARVIEARIERAVDGLNQCHERIYHAERQTRVRVDDRLDGVASVDLAELTKSVNFAVSNIAWQVWNIESLIRTLDFMDDIVVEWAEKARAHKYHEDEIARETNLLRRKHQYLRSVLTGLTGRTQYLSKRADAQVQTVSQFEK